MEIEVKSVLTNNYDNGPKIRQVPEQSQMSEFCARAPALMGWWDRSKRFWQITKSITTT